MPSRQRKPPDETPRRRGRKPDNDEFVEDEGSLRLHEAYLEYRVAGGAPATPEAYRRAVEQFDRLPGVIRARPEVGRSAPPAPLGSATPPGEEPHDDEPGGDS
jgi:hypothetical protein